MMSIRFALLAACVDLRSLACSFDRSDVAGMRDDDTGDFRRLLQFGKYPVLPKSVATENNAFVQNGLLRPLKDLSGNDKQLLRVLGDFAAEQGEDLCYWAFQGLPPPRGGPSPQHPFRKPWDVSDGHNDQDNEWVQAYGDIAATRLQAMVKKGGPVVAAGCAMGSYVMKRRCEVGTAEKWKCVPKIEEQAIGWPMALSIWKVGHPQLEEAITSWRSSAHVPNINWVMHLPEITENDAHPWNASSLYKGMLRNYVFC